MGARGLSRFDLAVFLGQMPGRGLFWGDDGRSFRVMLDPRREFRGESLDPLEHLFWPGAVPSRTEAASDGENKSETELWAGWCGYDVAARDLLRRRGHSVFLDDSNKVSLPERRGRMDGMGLRAFGGELRGGPDGQVELWGEVAWLGELLDFLDRGGGRAALLAFRWPFTALAPLWTPQRYEKAFDAVQEYLRAGDSYQVNLSQPFFGAPRERRTWPSRVLLDSAISFAYLSECRPGNLGALVEVGPQQCILSNSPELLFEVKPQGEALRIATGPIKGTRPRGQSPEEDQAFAQALLDSEKDAAEHRMIVDLLRNDLGEIAQPGSVRAPLQPTLITLATVFHLVSRIEAKLDRQSSVLELWRSLAPGGSITGAPKLRTVEIIDELEAQTRGIYCGSLFIADRRAMTASIAIRSAEIDPQGLHLRSGGGIVIDSQWQAEYQETLDKAQAFQGGF